MKLSYWGHIQSYRFTLRYAVHFESWLASCVTKTTSLYSSNKELYICHQKTAMQVQIMKSPPYYQTELGTLQTLITLIPHWNKLSTFLGGFMLWGWTAFTRIVFTCRTNKIFLLISLKYSMNSQTISFTCSKYHKGPPVCFFCHGFELPHILLKLQTAVLHKVNTMFLGTVH